MSEWLNGFITGLCVGIPLWGSFGALAIVLVVSAKRAGERFEPQSDVEQSQKPRTPRPSGR